MEINYLSDPKGNLTGVFIEIEEWRRLQKRYNIADNELADTSVKLQQELTDALKKAKLGE